MPKPLSQNWLVRGAAGLNGHQVCFLLALADAAPECLRDLEATCQRSECHADAAASWMARWHIPAWALGVVLHTLSEFAPVRVTRGKLHIPTLLIPDDDTSTEWLWPATSLDVHGGAEAESGRRVVRVVASGQRRRKTPAEKAVPTFAEVRTRARQDAAAMPKGNPKHYGWTVRRICLGERWTDIARSAATSPDAVRVAVSRISPALLDSRNRTERT